MKEHIKLWYGVPKTYLNTNRTFNPYNYENEVDDYGQTHFQLHYNEQINNKTFLNLARLNIILRVVDIMNNIKVVNIIHLLTSVLKQH